MDSLLQAIPVMVGCTETCQMLEKIQMLVQDKAKVVSREGENKLLC